jgi:hypothetical protein
MYTFAAKSPWGKRLCICLTLFLYPTFSALGSDNVQITVLDCALGIHLVARSARTQDVLRQLSAVLGFQLELAGDSDSVVDLDASGQAADLVTKLSPRDNLIVARSPDPRCPRKYRVTKVWMLPKGDQVEDRKPIVSGVPRQLTDAERNRIRQDDEAYRKAHGLPPVSDEDDAAGSRSR